MSERLRFIISGFFVGLAELLPGISGSTVAIAFNVYEKFILFLSNLKISNFSFSLKKLNQVFFPRPAVFSADHVHISHEKLQE
jgi:uncharacterized membrane protein